MFLYSERLSLLEPKNLASPSRIHECRCHIVTRFRSVLLTKPVPYHWRRQALIRREVVHLCESGACWASRGIT